jgi:hypothetical protein
VGIAVGCCEVRLVEIHRGAGKRDQVEGHVGILSSVSHFVRSMTSRERPDSLGTAILSWH